MSTTGRRISAGMVGGGPGADIGKTHRNGMRLDDRYCLDCGVFGQNREESLKLGVALGVAEDRIYSDYVTMAEAESARLDGVDLVVVATPNDSHFAIASVFLAKGISAGKAQSTYRGQVKVLRSAEGARNFTQCDSLLIGSECGAHTFPYIEVKNETAQVEHEASPSKIDEDQLFYCRQRGLDEEDASSMIVNGFCRDVFDELPMEFAVEAQALMRLSLEGTVG